MAIKGYKAKTPGLRFATSVVFDSLKRRSGPKKLVKDLKKPAGRSHGRITVRHKGGGVKKLYRVIDFKRDKRDVPGTVMALEYDPFRSALIALINYIDGEKRYILAPLGLKVGQTVLAGERVEIRPGNAMPLETMPLGTVIHNIELVPGSGGQLVRSAGLGATLMAKEGGFAHTMLPSGEIRKISLKSYATVGQLANIEHAGLKWGKAGRKRLKGIRPSVRGTAMPAGTHPHGGGEGRTGPGRAVKTIYGQPARGKTRKRGKFSDALIVQKRR